MGFFRKAALPDKLHIDLEGQQLEIQLRRNQRAKRYILRLPPGETTPVITVPARGTLKTAQDFADRHAGWLKQRLSARPDTVPFVEGQLIPIRGVMHELRPLGKLRGIAQQTRDPQTDEPLLLLPGETQSFPRKTTEFLKKQAKADLEHHVSTFARQLGRTYKTISLRDTKSRWGSCSAEGKLSFSWRLILAPPDILEYVAAHEVAHLMHMDHSPEFWQVCKQLAPHTDRTQHWLKQHGSQLHIYG